MRLAEIDEAIERYRNAELEIPRGWLEERDHLCSSLKGIFDED